MATKKDAFIILRVSASFKNSFEKLAKKAGVNLSKYIRQVLEESIK